MTLDDNVRTAWRRWLVASCKIPRNYTGNTVASMLPNGLSFLRLRQPATVRDDSPSQSRVDGYFAVAPCNTSETIESLKAGFL